MLKSIAILLASPISPLGLNTLTLSEGFTLLFAVMVETGRRVEASLTC